MKTVSAFLSLLSLATLAACAGNGDTHADGTFGHWQVKTVTVGKDKTICYAGTTPLSASSTLPRRESAYIMATRRLSGKIEISISSGYSYKKGSKADLVIDGMTYHLFFKDKTAWTRHDVEDKTIIDAIKKSRSILVLGTAESGDTSSDSYSPEGFADAIARVKALCP